MTKGSAKPARASKATARAPQEPPQPAQEPVHDTKATTEAGALFTAEARHATAVNVIDLLLKAIQARLQDDPSSIKASTITETTRLLALYFKEREALDDGEQARLEHEQMIASLGPMGFNDDDDNDDPLLQGNSRDHQPDPPAVRPEDIAQLADFSDD